MPARNQLTLPGVFSVRENIQPLELGVFYSKGAEDSGFNGRSQEQEEEEQSGVGVWRVTGRGVGERKKEERGERDIECEP